MKAEEDSASAEAAMLLVRAQVSFGSRIGHLTLLLVATGMSVAMTSLLATENGLPTRTAVALAAVLVINLCWAGYAVWVLSARRTMLFNHRVVAGRIALAATTAFAVGATALGVATGAAAAFLAAGMGLALAAVAGVLLVRAKRAFATLQRRRSELEALLSETAR